VEEACSLEDGDENYRGHRLPSGVHDSPDDHSHTAVDLHQKIKVN
jgi:hypothetical protein